MSVVLDSPSLAAAPSQPPSTPFVACKVASMCSRSTCASVRDAVAARLVRCSGSGSQRGARRRHDRSLDHVLKFTNVTWPRIILQPGDHLVGDFLDLLALTLGEPADVMGDEKRDVLDAFAQRGDPNGEHVQPIEEVSARNVSSAGLWSNACWESVMCPGTFYRPMKESSHFARKVARYPITNGE